MIPLSRDHKPEDPIEKERIVSCGGRVEPFTDSNGKPVGPLRIWLKNEEIPGLAMSRSIGDIVACRAGVNGEPELKEVFLTPADKMVIIASDGVWEFLSN